MHTGSVVSSLLKKLIVANGPKPEASPTPATRTPAATAAPARHMPQAARPSGQGGGLLKKLVITSLVPSSQPQPSAPSPRPAQSPAPTEGREGGGLLERLQQPAKPRVVEKDDRPRLATRIVSDGQRVGFSVAFMPGIEKVFKVQLGAWWLPQARMWVASADVVKSKLKEMDNWFEPFAWKVDPLGTGRYAAYALSKPREGCFSSALNIRLLPLVTGQTVIISDYDRILRQLLLRAGEWHESHSCFVSNYTPNQIANFLDKHGIFREAVYIHPHPLPDFDPADWIEEKRPRLKVGAALEADFMGQGEAAFKRAMEIVGKPMEILSYEDGMLSWAKEQFGLYDYQVDGVRHLIQHSSALLADDMGLGKTLQSLVAAHLRRVPGLPNLILCPASMRISWEREIKRVLKQDVVWQVGEPEPRQSPEWIVTSYEGLGCVLDRQYGVMVVDEAHYLKEVGSARTCNAFAVEAKNKYLLTGTPILNVERELYTLLKLGGHPIGQLPVQQFERMFAGNKILRRELGQHVQSWMLRRMKELVLKLKGKTWQKPAVTPPSDFRERYGKLEADDSLLAMVKIGRARQMLEVAKIDYIADYVGGLRQEDKVIVFCQYTQSIAAFQAAFEAAGIKYVTLTGADSLKKRQQAIDAFQKDKGTRIFLATTDAAYVGITLTAANYVMFASRPWTPGKEAQAEDRAYRNGQERPVIVVQPYIPGTLDEALAALLDHKRRIADDVMLKVDPDEGKQRQAEEAAAKETAGLLGWIGKKVATATKKPLLTV